MVSSVAPLTATDAVPLKDDRLAPNVANATLAAVEYVFAGGRQKHEEPVVAEVADLGIPLGFQPGTLPFRHLQAIAGDQLAVDSRRILIRRHMADRVKPIPMVDQVTGQLLNECFSADSFAAIHTDSPHQAWSEGGCLCLRHNLQKPISKSFRQSPHLSAIHIRRAAATF